MRVIITGATGFIGSNLARAFLARGDEVYAFVRPDSPRLERFPGIRSFLQWPAIWHMCGRLSPRSGEAMPFSTWPGAG